jgi:NADH-quinone oxidoreductase subunit J
MDTALFYIFSGIALITAINVVVQKKVFYSAISLILCLCSIAALYLLLEAPFIAAVQIIVYAGAIMVLFLFVIMLLDPFSAAILRDKKGYLGYAGIILGALILVLLVPLLKTYNPFRTPSNPEIISGGVGAAKNVGQMLFGEYLLPFEMTSVLILVAIIGVVVLSKQSGTKEPLRQADQAGAVVETAEIPGKKR